jgi:hypothetical protein
MNIGFDNSASDVATLQRNVDDAFGAVQAGFDQYHNPDGTHKTLPDLTVGVVSRGGTTSTGNATIEGSLTTGGARVFTGHTDLTLTATVNDLTLADGRPYDTAILRIDAAANRTITGLVPAYPDDFQRIFIVNVSAFTITLSHNSGSSTAGNRFLLPGDTDYEMRANERAELLYDPIDAAWYVAFSQFQRAGGGALAFTTQHQTVTITAPSTTGSVALVPVVANTNRAFLVRRTEHAGQSVTLTINASGATVDASGGDGVNTTTWAFTVVQLNA